MSEAHYLSKIYPVQDKIFQVFSKAVIRHYLTGGTALSRVFLNHRYSDDLDFFLNNDADFEKESDRAVHILHQNFKTVTIGNRQLDFRRIFITENEAILKLDFINDVAYHVNGFESTGLYYKTDNPLNILSNKIAALNRQTAKDIADIVYLCRKYDFTWPALIEEAAKKDNWVNEIDVLTAIKIFDQKKLFGDVAWIQIPDSARLEADIKKICFDIASAGRNSVVQSI